MSSKLYLGVRFPPKFERLTLKNIDLNSLNIESLQAETSKYMELPESGIVFLYCGQPLQNDKTLHEQGLQTGSTIQVLRKISKPVTKEFEKFAEIDVQELVTLFRSIKAVNFHKAFQPEFIKKVLESHPEIRDDLAAMAILKDPILLATMRNGDAVRLLAEHHRCLLDASKTIAEFLKTTPAPANQVSSIADTVDNDQLSDSSSESEASPSTSSQVRSMRRITTEQLASALNFAGTSSRNSLASISQRNLSQQQSVDGSPAATTSTTSTTPTRITNSMFMNALSEVLLSTRQQQAGRLSASNSASEIAQQADNQEESIVDTAAVTGNPSDVVGNPPMPMFLAELQQMREMGLADTDINMQALMITNGDVAAAVNLVFSGISN